MLLVAVAVAPAVAYAADMVAAAHERRFPSENTQGLDHWPTQAALALALVAVAALASLGRVGWRVPAWCAATSGVWLGVASWLYPHHGGGLDRVWSGAAVAWGLLFLTACEVAFRRTGGTRPKTPAPSTGGDD